MKSGVIEGLHKSLKSQFVFALQFYPECCEQSISVVPAKVCVIPQEKYSCILQNYIFYICKLTEKHQSIGLILLFAYNTAQMQSSARFAVPHVLKQLSEIQRCLPPYIA